MKNNNDIQKFLSEIYETDVEEFVIVARSKNGEDLKYSYKGNSVILSGLLAWFSHFINGYGFKSTYADINTN